MEAEIRQRWFHAGWLVSLLFLVYCLAFYVSASTPVARASAAELIQLIGLSWAIAGSFGQIFYLIGWLSLTAGLNQMLCRRLLAALLILCLALLALLVVENWFYSLFGWGLKSGDAFWVKVFFLALAGFIAYHVHIGIQNLAVALSKLGPRFSSALALSSLVCIPLSLSQSEPEASAQLTLTDNRPHILLISSDGVSADYMSLYGYEEETTPFLDSIADDLMIFEAAYTNNANTTGSITSLLTGISPATTKVIYPPDFLTDQHAKLNLPHLLSAYYHRTQWSVPHYASASAQGMTGAFNEVNGVPLTASELLPDLPLNNLAIWFLNAVSEDSLSTILDAIGIEEMGNPFSQVAEDDGDTLPTDLSDAERLEGLQRDIEQALQSKKKLFSQIHFMDTHGLKFFPQRRYFSAGMVQKDFWMTPFYIDSVWEFDDRIRVIFDLLKAKNILDDTLIFIFSDHAQKWKTYSRIPLLVRLPGAVDTGRFSVNVQLLDIAPTVIDFLQGAIPSWMQGQSLLRPADIPEDRLLIAAGFDAEVKSTGDGKGWQRAEVDGRPFRERNEFRVIYCNRSAKTVFPKLEMTFEVLPVQSADPGCSKLGDALLIEYAQQALEALLDGPLAPSGP